MRVPYLTLPLLVVIALFGGFFLRSAFTQPSTSKSLGASGTSSVECIVDGVKCKGTASLFTSHFEGFAGIGRIETFASEHKAVISYDPAILTVEDIRKKIESPMALDESTSVAFFKCVSITEITQTPTDSQTQ